MPTISKQHVIYAGGILVVLLVALAAFFLSPKLPFSVQEEVVTEKPAAETGVVSETTSTYTIDMKYPQFGISVIDTKIKEGVDAFVTEFKKQAESKLPQEAQYELASTFAGVYEDADVVSARLVVSQFTGGAHPGAMMYGLNYAKDTGKEIGLASVLRLIGAELSQVAEIATAELEKKLGDSFLPEGAKASSDNYWTYTINDKGVTFIFNEYQVAPYAAGPQRVSFARVVPPSTTEPASREE
jgi:peptidoglycan-N-acetylglucosamine deacetylase